MTPASWVGLIAAGPPSPALFRLPGLHLLLGPVAASTLRVASRLSNRLKAGHAVNTNGLDAAELIFLTGPPLSFPALLRLAEEAGIDWHGRTVALFDSRLDTTDLEALRLLGASVATLDPLDAFPDIRFVADADEPARRRLARFAAATRSHIFYLEPGRKQLFAAGSAFTGSFLAPLIAASADSLKTAGLTQAEALLIAEKNTQQTLRSWLKAGRKGWSGVLPDRDLDAACRQHAALGESFAGTARLALRLFGEDPAWLDSLPAPGSPIIEAMDDPQAQRLAATGRLAANLAHDWNNLLTLLAAQAGELANSLPDDHPAAAIAREMTASLSLATDPPRRLLRWLREEPGQRVVANLNTAIRHSLPLLRLALGRAIECRLELDETLPDLPLDEPLLRNALLNLASNAATAMNQRGVFTIRTRLTAEGVLLEIADDGPGMDAATRQRVFEPFFTTGGAGNGNGLGLETVRSLAAAHNATLDLESEPGAGARFLIRFPLAAAAKA